MGKVRITEFYRIAGLYEPVENIYEYTYCDKCGSFDLELLFIPYTVPLILIRVAIVVVIVAAVIAVGVLSHNWIVSCVASVIGWVIFIMIAPTKKSFLVCRKCGNDNITDTNVLNLDDEMKLLDVQATSAIRRFIVSRFNS